MDLEKPTLSGTRKSAVALAATIALTALWSSNAFSRTQTDADCDSAVHGLKVLDAPAEILVLKNVDHVSIEADSSQLSNADIATMSSESATPVLFLTPRVASTLRDIFDTGQDPRAQDIQSSPVAEAEESVVLPERADDAVLESQGEDQVDLPLLQRQMYRTDI